jgi:hypothetical protein
MKADLLVVLLVAELQLYFVDIQQEVVENLMLPLEPLAQVLQAVLQAP